MNGQPPLELVVVRHGETVFNAERRLMGQSDSPLSQLGLLQAEAIGESFANERVDVLYSSDLGRAMQTAEAVARATGRAIVPVEALRERHYGILQGHTRDEMERKFAAESTAERNDPSYAPPGGESAIEMARRVVEWIDRLPAQHPGRRVVVVAHGGPLTAMMLHTLGLTFDGPRRFKLYNASRNTFLHEDGRWILGTWGDIHHLGTIPVKDDY